MEVQILSRKQIAPSSPTPEHLRYLKISYLDQLAPPICVPRLFCYPPNEEGQGLNTTEKSELLKRSLSEALTLFYPLAGRYIKDKLLVDCNDNGAEYLEAQVSGSMSQLLDEGNSELQAKWLTLLAPDPVESESNPLALVQFNMFECGGVAIGLSLAHRVADGSSVFTFMDTWAKICRMGIGNIQFCPSFELCSFFPQRDASTPFKRTEAADDKLTTKRLVFNTAAISNLKAIASSTGTLKYQPTRVEVVLAFMWMSVIRLAKARHGHLRPSLLSIPVNMRKRTMLPIPENSWGNFVGRAVPRFSPEDDDKGKLQFHVFVGKVHDAVKSTLSNIAKTSTADDIVSLVDDANGELLEALQNPDLDCCISSSWCRFPKYEADLGWGKPSWVTVPKKPIRRNLIALTDTKEGDGIEALVYLDQNDLHLFGQDSEIMPLLCQEIQA
ncbi:hypothetical protein Tsubulata_047626 [Turnera subulata]|uniref:Uncharacterized protein n=1 Tax=Turnera subulata TaxID=218843 RepID=A0A9Q0FTA9_9ROSI|nr:hypothetical protein Tsubulata_047626 [Turnera subulata]